jgi:hypothetical protein
VNHVIIKCVNLKWKWPLNITIIQCGICYLTIYIELALDSSWAYCKCPETVTDVFKLPHFYLTDIFIGVQTNWALLAPPSIFTCILTFHTQLSEYHEDDSLTFCIKPMIHTELVNMSCYIWPQDYNNNNNKKTERNNRMRIGSTDHCQDIF